MGVLEEVIVKAASFSLEEDDLQQLIADNALDDQITALIRFEKMLNKLAISFQGESGNWLDLLKVAKENIAEQQQRILFFFEECFRYKSCIGSFNPEDINPDFIVVLGANPSVLESRITHAKILLKRFDSSLAVLSGGGYNFLKSEAQRIYDKLVEQGIDQCRLILESDAMDTVGNAVFTKLQLKRLGLLRSGLNILVVTSRFHAYRSLSYFQRVFGQHHHIAVSAVISGSNQSTWLRRAKNELKSEHDAQMGVFDFDFNLSIKQPQEQKIFLDEKTLLIQMLLKHSLYKYRFDLLRKFFD